MHTLCNQNLHLKVAFKSWIEVVHKFPPNKNLELKVAFKAKPAFEGVL